MNLCEDCEYSNGMKCSYEYPHYVHGDLITSYCATNRRAEGLCGHDGKWFKQAAVVRCTYKCGHIFQAGSGSFLLVNTGKKECCLVSINAGSCSNTITVKDLTAVTEGEIKRMIGKEHALLCYAVLNEKSRI